MRKIIAIILFVHLSLICFSQNKYYTNNRNFFVGVTGGLNLSKYRNDSVRLSYGEKLAIGVYGERKFTDKISLKGSVLYAARGSNSNAPFFKIKNQYVDFTVLPQYGLFNNFLSLGAGVCYSKLFLSERKILDGNGYGGFEIVKNEGYNSNYSIVTGCKFQFTEKINIRFDYYIPLTTKIIRSFQITMNVIINYNNAQKISNRRERRESTEQ